MKKKIIVYLLLAVIITLAAACGGSKIPSGYSKLNSESSEGVNVTNYVGKGSQDKAAAEFVKWAEKSGWTKSKDTQGLDMLGYMGTVLENKKEMMIIQAFEVSGQVTVMVVTAPKE